MRNVCSGSICRQAFHTSTIFDFVPSGFMEWLPHPDKTSHSILLGHPQIQNEDSFQKESVGLIAYCMHINIASSQNVIILNILNRMISTAVVWSHFDCSQYLLHRITNVGLSEVYSYRFAIACWCSGADAAQSTICFCWRKLEWCKLIVWAWKKKKKRTLI